MSVISTIIRHIANFSKSTITTTTRSPSIPYSLRNRKYETNEDVTKFWVDAGKIYADSIDRQIYKEQETHFLDIIREELDLNKLETVLDVGVGYGRIAKIILDNAPNIREYDGIDISQDQLDSSWGYVGKNIAYHAFRMDFEDIVVENWRKYDLVISTEYMTCIPYDVQPTIDKMIAMSKKYVVNLDHYTEPREKSLEDNILRNWHFYPGYYTRNKDVVNLKGTSIPKYSQQLFVARVK